MELGISGKLAVVTGASRGLGLAAARELGREGSRVVLVARDGEAVRDAARQLAEEGVEAVGLSADLTDQEQVAALFERIRGELGDPDILVYNNSGARDHSFDDASDEDFRHAYEILVMGFVWCVRQVVPAMRRRRWGRIVTLGSLCAREPHKEFPMVLHNLGRPAQVGLSKTLANELGRFGITVNTIGTGMLDHDGQAVSRAYADAAARGMTAEEVQQLRVGPIPVGRAGRADELGALCAFLCSERAAFITGQMILLNGGRVASLM